MAHISAAAPDGVGNEQHKPRELFSCANTHSPEISCEFYFTSITVYRQCQDLDYKPGNVCHRPKTRGLFSQTDIPLGFPGLLLASRNFGPTILLPSRRTLSLKATTKHLVSVHGSPTTERFVPQFDSCICCQLLQQTVRKLHCKLVF